MGDQYAVFSFLSAYELPSNTWNFMHVYDQPDDNARFLFCGVPDFALPEPEVVDDDEDEDDYDPEEFGFDPPHPEVTKWLQKGDLLLRLISACPSTQMIL